MRALADFIPPYGVRQLATVSGASAPVISRVLALLDREGVVERDPRGTVIAVTWTDVLRRWVDDYSFAKAHRAVPCLDPRGLPAFSRKLATWPGRWAATGTMGVPRGVEVVPLHLAAIYVDAPEQAAGALGLKRVEVGANVVLVEPVDEGVFARSARGDDGVTRCAPSQVFADLLTGPGRGSAEAEALLGWMQGNESAWRTRP